MQANISYLKTSQKCNPMTNQDIDNTIINTEVNKNEQGGMHDAQTLKRDQNKLLLTGFTNSNKKAMLHYNNSQEINNYPPTNSPNFHNYRRVVRQKLPELGIFSVSTNRTSGEKSRRTFYNEVKCLPACKGYQNKSYNNKRICPSDSERSDVSDDRSKSLDKNKTGQNKIKISDKISDNLDINKAFSTSRTSAKNHNKTLYKSNLPKLFGNLNQKTNFCKTVIVNQQPQLHKTNSKKLMTHRLHAQKNNLNLHNNRKNTVDTTCHYSYRTRLNKVNTAGLNSYRTRLNNNLNKNSLNQQKLKDQININSYENKELWVETTGNKTYRMIQEASRFKLTDLKATLEDSFMCSTEPDALINEYQSMFDGLFTKRTLTNNSYEAKFIIDQDLPILMKSQYLFEIVRLAIALQKNRLIYKELQFINAFNICFSGVEIILIGKKDYPGEAKLQKDFQEVLINNIGTYESLISDKQNGLDILLSGIGFYEKLGRNFEKFDKADIRYVIVSQYTYLLEIFLSTIQKSIADKFVGFFNNKNWDKLDICMLIVNLFFTEEGQILLSAPYEKGLLENYENSFKIAARVVLTSMENDEDLSKNERLIISEIFRFIFTGMKNGYIFKQLKNYLVNKTKISNILVLVFDSYFKFFTKYCSPLAIMDEESKKIILIQDLWAEMWNNKQPEHDYLNQMDEIIIGQLNMLIYQITYSYDLRNHNTSTLQIIKKMVLVIIAILSNKDVYQAKAIFKKIKSGFKEILTKFCTNGFKNMLKSLVDEINEIIIDFFKDIEGQKKFVMN